MLILWLRQSYLSVGLEDPAFLHFHVHSTFVAVEHFAYNFTIVNVDGVVRLNCLRQVLIVTVDQLVSRLLVGVVATEEDVLAYFQLNLAILNFRSSNLPAPGVKHERTTPMRSQPLRFLELFQKSIEALINEFVNIYLHISVGEVEASTWHSRIKELDYVLHFRDGWSAKFWCCLTLMCKRFWSCAWWNQYLGRFAPSWFC